MIQENPDIINLSDLIGEECIENVQDADELAE